MGKRYAEIKFDRNFNLPQRFIWYKVQFGAISYLAHRSTCLKICFVPKTSLTRTFLAQRLLWRISLNGALVVLEQTSICRILFLSKYLFVTKVNFVKNWNGGNDQSGTKKWFGTKFDLMKTSFYHQVRVVAWLSLVQITVYYKIRLGANLYMAEKSNKQIRLYDSNSQLIHKSVRIFFYFPHMLIRCYGQLGTGVVLC